jgi:hypothetical protein
LHFGTFGFDPQNQHVTENTISARQTSNRTMDELMGSTLSACYEAKFDGFPANSAGAPPILKANPSKDADWHQIVQSSLSSAFLPRCCALGNENEFGNSSP